MAVEALYLDPHNGAIISGSNSMDPTTSLSRSMSDTEGRTEEPLSGRQMAVYEALVESGGETARIYLGAILVFRTSNPDRFALAAHGMRELLERLPIAQEIQRDGDASLKSLVGNLRADWDRAVDKSGNTDDGSEWTGEIDGALNRLLKRLGRFLKDANKLRPPRRNRAEQFVRETDPIPSGLPDSLTANRVNQWVNLRGYFTKMSHHGQDPAAFSDYLESAETFLLDHLRPRTYEDRFELLEIIAKGESDDYRSDLVRKARQKMKRAADYAFFFDQLQSPGWIPALLEQGFLKEPPPAFEHGGYISYPPWPEAAYLARVSSEAPEEVAYVITSIPKTDNPVVSRDLTQAVANMPADRGRGLCEEVLSWIDDSSRHLVLKPAMQLTMNLLSNSHTTEAVTLALRIAGVPHDEDTAIRWGERSGHQADYLVKEPLRDFVSSLDGEAALLGLNHAGTGLRLVLEAKLGDPDSWPAGDHSCIWRPAIAQHEQNTDFDSKVFLVELVRDLAEVAADDPDRIGEVVATLEGWRWSSFLRIAMHLARRHLSELGEKAAVWIIDPAVVGMVDVQHEYYWLVHDTFAMESPPLPLTSYLEMVEQGPPDRSNQRTRSSEEERTAITGWMIERLHPVKEVLPEEWAKKYAEWADELGEPDHPDFPFYMSRAFTMSRVSPMSAEELAGMEPASVVEFLANWKPTNGIGDPQIDDLGSSLAGAAALAPAKFADSAELFRVSEPTYARSFLEGLRNSLQDNGEFEWAPVLALGSWIVSQTDEAFDRSDWKQDPDWSWTRKTLADLIRAGLESKHSPIPLEFDSNIFELLGQLIHDPNPSPQHEEEYGGTNMDPLTLSLNTIRGSAFHGVFAYIHWLNSNKEEGEKRIPDEVKGLLDDHLDIARDPSLAVRATYGWGFGWLADIDEAWSRDRVRAIFPVDPDLDAFRAAAWLGFMSHWRASSRLFEILAEPYEIAIQRLPTNVEAGSQNMRVDENLGSHLLSFYWWGTIDPRPDNPLLMAFYKHAPDELRGQMTRTIGSALAEAEEVTEDVVGRSIALWDYRNESLDRESATDRQSELGSFVWWFQTDLDPTWLMQELLRVSQYLPVITSAFVVAERLPTFFAVEPIFALRTLQMLLEKDEWGHVAIGHQAEVRSVLSQAFAVGGDAAERAHDVVNWLGARGRDEYSDLLTENGTSN